MTGKVLLIDQTRLSTSNLSRTTAEPSERRQIVKSHGEALQTVYIRFPTTVVKMPI